MLITIFTIWQREIIRYGRDKTRIVATFVQPLMFLAIFGTGLRQTLATGDFGLDFLQFMYPGIIAMSVMGVAFFSTISTVWDREFGFLKEILVAPVRRSAIVLGKVFGAASLAAFQALILLGLSPLIGVKIQLLALPGLLFFMILIGLAIAALGLLIASLMKTTESFGLIMQILIFPMFFMSGAFFPLNSAPIWMRTLSGFNPLSYGVDALRQILQANQATPAILDKFTLHSPIMNAAFLLAFSSLAVSAAILAFNKKA